MLFLSENLFIQTFPHTIWRILPHPAADSDQWVVELRDAEQKTVSWALLDLATPGLCWIETPAATDWWTSLTAFSGSHVYLHSYRYPDIPEPTDLLALSAVDGSLQWVLPGWVYVRGEAAADRVVVARKLPEHIEYRVCDAGYGLLTDAPVAEAPAPAATTREPARYSPDDIYFGVVSSFLGKIVGVHSPIAIDYLELNPYIVFSYYLYQQEKVAQYLLIVNRQQEIIYHELLSANRQGVGRNTLLAKADGLVCLRNSNELISIKLTP